MISWEYLAGMIDADGSIGTTKTGKNKNIVGRVIVANTDHDFLRTLQNQFDGYISLRSVGQKENWKPFGCITWSNRKAETILENVKPFLLIKQRQAELVLELIRMKNAPKSERFDYTKHNSGAFAVLKPEIKTRETEIASTISLLNKKGI